MKKNKLDYITQRLEYLRGEIKAERISYGEIAELQSLARWIDRGDVLLLEWAGVPELVDVEEIKKICPTSCNEKRVYLQNTKKKS